MCRTAIAALLASTISAHAEDWSGSYYCKMTASGGIKLDRTTNRWESARFDVRDDAIFVTAKATGQTDDTIFGPVPTYTIEVKEFGQGQGLSCTYDSKPIVERAYVPVYNEGGTRCSSVTSEFKLNFKHLRILVMYAGGYMDVTGSNTDSPSVAVGKCDKVG